MALTPYTASTAVIAALADEPNDTGATPLTADQMKAKYDEAMTAFKTWFNATHIPELDAAQLPYIYGAATTIKQAMEALVAGVVPDDSVDADMLKSDSVTTAKILDENVTLPKLPANVQADIGLIQKNLLNILKLKLQVSLSSSDYDAWSDLFADYSLLNLASTVDVMVDSGALKTSPIVSMTTTGGESYKNVGTVVLPKGAQTFTPLANMNLASVVVRLKKEASPTDNVLVKIYATAAGVPTTVLYTSSTTLDGATLTTDFANKTFAFSTAPLTANTVYAIVVERSGAADNTNYYMISNVSTAYTGGSYCAFDGTTWTADVGTDTYFVATGGTTGTAIWTAKTPTEALTYAAVCTSQTVGTGSIAWYLSDDGTAWVAVTATDTIQAFNFDATAVHLKCVLTGNATVEGVAYGGY